MPETCDPRCLSGWDDVHVHLLLPVGVLKAPCPQTATVTAGHYLYAPDILGEPVRWKSSKGLLCGAGALRDTSAAQLNLPDSGQGRIAMKKILGATAGLLILVGAVVPAGQSASAASWDWPKGQISAASWDWPK